MTPARSQQTPAVPPAGARVVRTLGGRDWPGTVRPVGPYADPDGIRVRVKFDDGAAGEVLAADLRPEEAS